MTSETQHNAIAMRIKELRKQHHLSQGAFGDKIGVSKSAISLFEAGTNRPKLDTLNRIVAEFGVSLDWLQSNASANGGRTVATESTAAVIGSPDEQDYVELEFVPYTAYGTFAENCRDARHEEFSTVRILRMPGMDYTKAVVIEVRGNSMAPRYPHGCRVVARWVSDGNWQHSTGVHCVSIRETHMFVIKRIVANQEGNITLSSDGTGETMNITLGDINCMWKVGEIVYIPAED